MREHRAHVVAAHDYEGALEAVTRETPSIIVSDIGLPGKDGYELIREIRHREIIRGARHVPAVALTAFGRPEDKAVALAAGFDAHIAKPFEPHALISTIQRLARPRSNEVERPRKAPCE
ncbi:MAG: response regulator [Myxococcota bacterium]